MFRLTNNRTADFTFDWSKHAGPLNFTSDRTLAAYDLATHVLNTHKEGEDITLIGVSHGGNVIIQTAKILGNLGYKVNIITVNTPVENDENDQENPKDNQGINDMIQITTSYDYIRTVLGTELAGEYDKPSMYRLQYLRLKTDHWINPHATENVDTKQIDNSELKKLKPTNLTSENSIGTPIDIKTMRQYFIDRSMRGASIERDE